MGNPDETVAFGESRLVLRRKAVLDLDNRRALVAHEVVVMVVRGVCHQLETCCSVAEIETLDQTHRGQRVHVPVNRGEVAVVFPQGRMNFAVGQGAGVPP